MIIIMAEKSAATFSPFPAKTLQSNTACPAWRIGEEYGN
ncbi:hypothetical protein LCAZH_0996 [Lacticaseibacillus paracasei]|nr:hypothetical protein LCAZH_0996 [Lacticaseibacillus paracasei]